MPGQGSLPLAELVARFDPVLPISVEVQSDALERAFEPVARARRWMDALRPILS